LHEAITELDHSHKRRAPRYVADDKGGRRLLDVDMGQDRLAEVAVGVPDDELGGRYRIGAGYRLDFVGVDVDAERRLIVRLETVEDQPLCDRRLTHPDLVLARACESGTLRSCPPFSSVKPTTRTSTSVSFISLASSSSVAAASCGSR
jgi:hypothetical protein